jgi:hypothetical protein
MLADPWMDAPSDFARLRRTLNECGVAADQIEQTVRRLTRPPRLFGMSALQDDPGLLSRVEIRLGAGLDDDMAARLLYPGKGATWKALSNPEKKRANRLRDWFGKPHGLSTNPKGQPPSSMLPSSCIARVFWPRRSVRINSHSVAWEVAASYPDRRGER